MPGFNDRAESFKAQQQKQDGGNAEQVIEAAGIVEAPEPGVGQQHPIFGQSRPDDEGVVRQSGCQPVNHRGVDIPQQKEQQGDFQVAPGFAGAGWPFVEEMEQEDERHPEKEVGHLMNDVPFRAGMDLDRPRRARDEHCCQRRQEWQGCTTSPRGRDPAMAVSTISPLHDAHAASIPNPSDGMQGGYLEGRAVDHPGSGRKSGSPAAGRHFMRLSVAFFCALVHSIKDGYRKRGGRSFAEHDA